VSIAEVVLHLQGAMENLDEARATLASTSETYAEIRDRLRVVTAGSVLPDVRDAAAGFDALVPEVTGALARCGLARDRIEEYLARL
jgi:hypothetical protein